MRTGKGSAGGLYRYYTRSTKARQGKTGCEGRSIPMDRLDQLVASHLEERLASAPAAGNHPCQRPRPPPGTHRAPP
ncbi:zinc ribbon domain-containing protein [Sphingopyxis flava]|nr:zinc ribbon domain-containing protein [Sphingopyxis flava]